MITGTATRDGRRLHWTRAGTGAPTILLEAGIGASSTMWDLVAPRLAEITQVLSYDRAGYRGGPPTATSGAEAVLDLEEVLQAAEVPGPLVLVGHSWGGVLNRLYTAAHPDRIAGVVLVDATHEGMTLLRNPVVSLLNRAGTYWYLRNARHGTLRRRLETGAGELGRMLLGLPEPGRGTLLGELCDPRTWEQARHEMRAVEASLRTVEATMPAIPVVAIVGTRATGHTGRRTRTMTHNAYQHWIPTLADGRLVEAPHSGHAVAHHDPDLLVTVLHDLITRLRVAR